ncbi:hypothetical protein NECAME_10169, partial [Necator americanus]
QKEATHYAKSCLLSDKGVHLWDGTSAPRTKPIQQPTKTMLQLLDRSSRPDAMDAPIRMEPQEDQLTRERPAYARRFMLNRNETNDPILCRPSIDEGLTPFVPVSEELKELSHFVLPSLPLGLRSLSPEPRSLLLNAPKKRRISPPSCYSSVFDLSCFGRVLKPYKLKNLTQKRSVCRVLRFGE